MTAADYRGAGPVNGQAWDGRCTEDTARIDQDYIEIHEDEPRAPHQTDNVKTGNDEAQYATEKDDEASASTANGWIKVIHSPNCSEETESEWDDTSQPPGQHESSKGLCDEGLRSTCSDDKHSSLVEQHRGRSRENDQGWVSLSDKPVSVHTKAFKEVAKICMRDDDMALGDALDVVNSLSPDDRARMEDTLRRFAAWIAPKHGSKLLQRGSENIRKVLTRASGSSGSTWNCESALQGLFDKDVNGNEDIDKPTRNLATFDQLVGSLQVLEDMMKDLDERFEQFKDRVSRFRLDQCLKAADAKGSNVACG